jgi:hypothetical protein
MFSSLEPVFDGSLTRLPRSKELLCPGTFFFFQGSGMSSDSKQLGRIVQCTKYSNSTVTINIFQPLLPEGNINPLSHSRLEGTVQVIQTSKNNGVDPIDIIEVSFVIPYVELLDVSQFIEVSGMELVRVLHGRLHNDCFEEIFTASFPSCFDQYHNFYHLTDDVCCTKWVEVVLPVQSLISCLLYRAYLL